MKPKSAAIAAILLAAIVACRGIQATPTTSTSAPPTETTAPPATTTPTGSEDVAQAFFEAWRRADTSTMEALAVPAAVIQADELADLVGETWEFVLCEGAAGTVFCSWTSAAGTLAVGVRNIEEPHVVTSVRLMEA